MTLTLGTQPDGLSVVLIRGADFIAGMDSLDGDWPTIAVIALTFNDADSTSWTAAINGPAVDWNIDKAQVAALMDRLALLDDTARVRLTYVDGATDLLWARGGVQTVGW